MSIEALHPGPTSAEVIRDIFAMHFTTHNAYDPLRVLDLTYGKGVFWKWDYRSKYPYMKLTKNDLYNTPVDGTALDFTLPSNLPNNYFDIVVFDPPHSAHGPSSDSKRYGSSRDLTGAPQNYKEVYKLLAGGIMEATRLASWGVIIKTMSVIESNIYRTSHLYAGLVLANTDFYIDDEIYFLPPRRPQPDKARGAKVKHFRNRPSVFIVGKRVKEYG
jgi:hypothetical protein